MAISENPFISVVIPVKNAAQYLRQCLESLNNLDYPKDKYEVIVSDSDSTDGTQEIAASMGARVITAQGPSVCSARNSGFIEAKGEIIAFSDADCVMDKDWLSNAVKYFRDDTVGCVGGPSLIPKDETAFGKACGFIFSYPLFTGGSTYGLNFTDTREVPHNPGCNAIYRRSALERVMPIDECFIEGEDVIMNKRLYGLGYRFLYTPDTRLWHYRSSTPRRFFRQNFRYATGRVMMWRAYKELVNPLHAIAGFSIPLMLAAFIIAWRVNAMMLPVIIAAGIGSLACFFVLALVKTRSPMIALNVPLAIALLMIPWSLGFMKEIFYPSNRKR